MDKKFRTITLFILSFILFRFSIQAEVKVTSSEHIVDVLQSETRIIMLYATREEAAEILDWAKEKELTGNNYVWIVTQSVIGESRNGQAPSKSTFPIGMLGKPRTLTHTQYPLYTAY